MIFASTRTVFVQPVASRRQKKGRSFPQHRRLGLYRQRADLELVSQSFEEALADERAGQVHEGLVQFGAALPADAQAAVLVQPGEGSLDDPAHSPEARAVLGGAAGDDRLDAAGPQLAAVPV